MSYKFFDATMCDMENDYEDIRAGKARLWHVDTGNSMDYVYFLLPADEEPDADELAFSLRRTFGRARVRGIDDASYMADEE